MISRKQTMQEPARRAGFTVVEAIAIKPEAAAILIFDAIIIACRRAFRRAPPFRCNALWPIGAYHRMQHAPPSKADRRPIWHFCENLDPFGRFDQADGPCGRRFCFNGRES